MPPKKKKAPAASSAPAPASSSPHVASIRSLQGALIRSLDSHAMRRQQAAAPPAYGEMVDTMTKDVKELEETLSQIVELEKDGEKSRVVDSSSSSTPSSSSSSDLSFTPASSINPTQSDLHELASWLHSIAPSCRIGSIWEFAPSSDIEGTGIRALKDLETDQLFMSIPRTCMMTTDGLAKTSPIGKILADDTLCMKMPSLLLACCLIYERSLGSNSYWAPYIRCLPKHVNLPMTWSVDHIRHYLQSSPTVYDVLSLKHGLVRQYVHLLGVFAKKSTSLPSTFDFTWTSFQWAVTIVMSRQNRVPALNSASETCIALIPGWDSCNHRGHGAVATFYLPETHESQSHTMEAVKAGEPIFLYYGPRTNAHLMTYAGFVDTNHRRDGMEFILELDGRAAFPSPTSASSKEEDPLGKIKLMLLKKAGIGATFGMTLPIVGPAGEQSTSSNSADTTPEQIAQEQERKQRERMKWNAMMHFIRVCALSSKDAVALALKHKPAFGNPLSPSFHFLPSLYPEHDLHAFTFLHDALIATLHSYGTTLEHDESELLRDEVHAEVEEHTPSDSAADRPKRLSQPHRLAVEQRRAEKKLLQTAATTVLQWKNEQHAKVAN